MGMEMSATVLIVDDHPMFRFGVSHFLRPYPNLAVIEATSQLEATVALREHQVDLAIVDISLPDGSGLELIRHHRALHTRTKWLIYSVYSETFHQKRARRVGANGFLSKRAGKEDLLRAVENLLDGKDFPPGFEASSNSESAELEMLSEREMTVFRLISEGNSVEQIANSLARSRKTINAIRDRIRGKLSIRSSAELTRYATQWYLSQHENEGVVPPRIQYLDRPTATEDATNPDH